MQTLDTVQPGEKLTDGMQEAKKAAEDTHLFKLWVLADKLLIPQLQNSVLHKVQEICTGTNIIPTSSITYVYDNTHQGSPLRRWILNECASLQMTWFEEHPTQFPKDMLLELVVLWKTASNRGNIALAKEKMEEYEVDVPED